jgi:N-glycosylase/DNA lyase
MQSITPPSLFHLHYTLMCGQIFGWKKIAQGFAGLIDNRPLYLEQHQHAIFCVGSHEKLHISRFFRWDDPLEEIKKTWENEPILVKAFYKYQGLRLIRQNPWDCLVGFILSSYSNIPKIKKNLENIAKYKKKSLNFMGTKLYSVPSPEEIASMREKTLRALGIGFRAPYLLECAKKIANGFPLETLKRLPFLEARKSLMELPGIGEKVADCILLFSLEHLEAFPVDVWIQRALEKFYFEGKSKSPKYLSEWGRERFGKYAGYAQQYLYMLARDIKKS